MASITSAVFYLTGLAIVLLGYAALSDVATRRIPNWVSALVALLGAALRLQDGQLALSLAIAVGAFGGLYVLWTRGWIGGGDVKLLAATTLLASPGQVLNLLLAVSFAGGLLSAIYLLLIRMRLPLMQAGSRAPLRRVIRAERWRIRRGGPLPYACAISAGGLLAFIGLTFSGAFAAAERRE